MRAGHLACKFGRFGPPASLSSAVASLRTRMIPPTTWSELAAELGGHIQTGRKSRPDDLPVDTGSLRTLVARHRERLDIICDHWALSGEWMMMTPAEEWFLMFRMIHGQILALRLTRKTATGQDIETPSRPEALRWLIADSWLPSDDEEVVRSACCAFQRPAPLPPNIRGLT